MLVLSRKPGESLRIGEVVVCIIDSKPNRVKIGINAPPTTYIVRAELEDVFDDALPIPTAPPSNGKPPKDRNRHQSA